MEKMWKVQMHFYPYKKNLNSLFVSFSYVYLMSKNKKGTIFLYIIKFKFFTYNKIHGNLIFIPLKKIITKETIKSNINGVGCKFEYAPMIKLTPLKNVWINFLSKNEWFKEK